MKKEKINRVVFSTFAILAASASKYGELKKKSIEFSDLRSLNSHIEDLSNQDDYFMYFPFIANVKGEYLLIPGVCQVI